MYHISMNMKCEKNNTLNFSVEFNIAEKVKILLNILHLLNVAEE